MDFLRQIPEERSSSSYDVIMESPLVSSLNENILDNRTNKPDSGQNMTSSLNSTLEDTTPSDSGVQMLDSESSEFMIESITSQTGFDFDDVKAQNPIKELAPYSAVVSNEMNALIQADPIETVDTNSNVTKCAPNAEEAMTTSTCSTFDTTENIVYRRKVRKTQSAPKVPKKRVSFHEDILKNTRTDNIHIEHGFITYKNGRKLLPKTAAGVAGRYSWCSEGDGASEAPTELCAQLQGEEDCDTRRRRRVVYRNACSDVLDYGNSDVYDTNESNCLQYDNSGVFEYQPQKDGTNIKSSGAEAHHLYRCSCSSSNSSLDSEENDKNSNRQEYAQAKSSSCDCIGISNANNNLIGDNCYFSEPNIDNINESSKKSVWNKEKKPKSSCLKKTNTNFIYEQDINSKVKKFNVHDMNMLLDNSSKMIFGSLKSIFTMPLPERGVPEGSEDLQAVVECLPEMEQQTSAELMKKEIYTYPSESPPLKSKPFLSKSLDGSKQNQATKKFVHNVDEQLRRKNMNVDLFALTNESEAESMARTIQRQEEFDKDDVLTTATEATSGTEVQVESKQFRNKFIINCESTVFEHTGVSYENNSFIESEQNKYFNFAEKNTPIAQPEHNQLRNAFISVPIAKTFSNFFRGFKESNTSTPSQKSLRKGSKQQEQKEMHTPDNDMASTSLSSSIKSESITTSTNSLSQPKSKNSLNACSSSLVIGQDFRNILEKQSRHLPSPLKKRTSINNLMLQPPRYGTSGVNIVSEQNSLLSPDLFNDYAAIRGGNGRDSKSTILSDEFDDILTITTDTDKNENDIVIVDYPDSNERQNFADCSNLLRPPHQPAKTSLINRFLRNVTQKKILETSIRKNDFFAGKLKNEQKLFANDLYVPGVRPKNYDLIDDLNAEIAMEIEMSGVNSPRRELISIESDLKGNGARFELGIGEISVDIFNGNHLHILRDKTEQLMKVFKLYTGYSREGFMTPVLVFLTDKALYVTDLVRNRLCSKFVLPYVELDVILMGPYGNTVLLSNSLRDMQQVLLAGGPYPAYGLVANLELCTRRSGSILPAVGQLTLDHLAPLRKFVRENSSVGKNDIWMYYAVVNIPVGTIGNEQEPLGPNIKGFLMHRRIKSYNTATKQGWSPGYFLLKAGVLYMFNDSSHKLPSWAMALAECQGARRAINTGRPHCFEIMLKKELLQLAAPDEYVASEWLQALLQSASGLFEMQKKHKTLGCSLVVTENYLITLREDFTAPLQINKHNIPKDLRNEGTKEMAENYTNNDTGSLLNSALSTPVKSTQRSCSSANSTPTMLSQISKSTFGAGGSTLSSTPTSATTNTNYSKQPNKAANNLSTYSNMYSVYGIKSGLEILTCADIKDMTGIKIPSHNDTWWCILEFSCQEVRECTDDLVIFFSSSSEMQRFLRLLEQLWQAKNNDLFPITVLDEDDVIAEQCTMLYIDINRSWEPLLSAALGYPL